MSLASTSRLRVALITLGCKVNLADSQQLLARLGSLVIQVPFHEPAELYLINSCTVTAAADRRTRQLVYRAKRTNPAAIIVLTGCLAQASPEVAARIPAVDHVIALAEQQRLIELITQLSEASQRGQHDMPASASSSASCLPQQQRLPGQVSSDLDAGLAVHRMRPLLKIQDGCEAACSYCVVPLARGPSTSVPLAQALSTLRALAAMGHQEVVVTGIHLGLYGRDLEPPLDLTQAVRQLLGLVPRLRLSSIEPLEVTSELVELLVAETRQLCPHLHLPVQSGDEGILRAMNRPYRPAEAWTVFSQVRQKLPEAALGSDLMVGFPGETEECFAHSLDFVERSPLTHLHVFPFSPRPGTSAADLPGRVPPEQVHERVLLLREAGLRKLRRFMAGQVGTVRQVLVEGQHPDGTISGLTDNYLRVVFAGEAAWAGRLIAVALERAEQSRLQGRVITAPC